MSTRKWTRLPPFSRTPPPSHHRYWRPASETPPEQPEVDTDWADDDSQAASSTISATPSAGPPRKKRKTRKHFFTRPKSRGSTREPTWDSEEEDPDMQESITVAGAFLTMGQGAIAPRAPSPPPPPPSKQKGTAKPPAAPKTPGSTARKKRGGRAKAANKPTPTTATRKGRSAANAAKQASPELGHPESPHPPARTTPPKLRGVPSADWARPESPAPRPATPPPLQHPHAQDNPIPNIRNEIPSSAISSDSGAQTPPNTSTPISTDPAPPEPPPAPASAKWSTELTPPPPNPHLNELARRLTFNLYAFPALNHPCYVFGEDLIPVQDERSSPLADIYPDAQSTPPPPPELKPSYEQLRDVVREEMGLKLPEAGSEQEWGVYINYHFPVHNQRQLDECMAHLVHYGRPVHDIVLVERGSRELFQAALDKARIEDRDFWKGRREQMPDVRTGVILHRRGMGMPKAKKKPRNNAKKKGKGKERKEPAAKKHTAADNDTEMDMGREIRDSMEPSPAPTSASSALVGSLAPEASTKLLRISPVPNASQEGRSIGDDKSTTGAPTPTFSTKPQNTAASPPPAPQDNEKENESLQDSNEATDSARTGKRKLGGYVPAASASMGLNRNAINKWSSATAVEAFPGKWKGKGKGVDVSSSKESSPSAGPERKRRKTRTVSPAIRPFVPDISIRPEEPERPGVPMVTDAPEDPEIPAETEPPNRKESPMETEPPKEIEPPKETEIPRDIEPQTVPEVSQTSPVPAEPEIMDSTVSTETQEIQQQQTTGTAEPPPTRVEQGTSVVAATPPTAVALETPQTVIEIITPETPGNVAPPVIPAPHETPQETAKEQHPETPEKEKIPEAETRENTVATGTEHLLSQVAGDVRVRAKVQKLVTTDEVKPFHSLDSNGLHEVEAKEKESEAVEAMVGSGVNEGEEEKQKIKVVSNEDELVGKEIVNDKAAIEEPGKVEEEKTLVKESDNDEKLPTKEPEVASSTQGTEHKDMGKTPAKEVASKEERQSTPQLEGKQVVATALNAVVASEHTADAPKVDELPAMVVEEPQVPAPTPSVVVAGRIEDEPVKAFADSGHASEADHPARSSTLSPPPPPQSVNTPIDISSACPNKNIDVIMINDDVGESSVQPTLPGRDLSAANTVSKQDPTVPMDIIYDESLSPVNNEGSSKGKGKETLEHTDAPDGGQEPTAPEPATNDTEAEGASPVQTYSQSVVDIQHGASLLLWAAEVPTEELASDAPVLESSSPMPSLPTPLVTAPAAPTGEAQGPRQLDEQHAAIAVTPTPPVKRRSRAKNPPTKDNAKPLKETAKSKTPKTKPAGLRASSKRSLIVSLKVRKTEVTQDEGSHSHAEESHSDGTIAASKSHICTPPPASPSNNWHLAPSGFTPVNPSPPVRLTPTAAAPLPRPQPYRRPEPTNTPRQIAMKPASASPKTMTPSVELLAAARKQTGQAKNTKSKVASSRVGSATSSPDYPNAPIPSPTAPPLSLGRLASRRSLLPETTSSPSRPVQQQLAVTPSHVDDPPQQASVVAASPSQSVIPPVHEKSVAKEAAQIPDVSPVIADKGTDKEIPNHPIPEDSPPTNLMQPAQAPTTSQAPQVPDALVSPPVAQLPQTPMNKSGRGPGPSTPREMYSNGPSGGSEIPNSVNPLSTPRIDSRAPPSAGEPVPASIAASIPHTPSATTTEKAMASTKSPALSIDVTNTRQSTPLSLPPARSTLTPEYIEKKIQPLVPRENFLYWEPSIGKGGADIKQPIGTLLGDATSATISPIHASASGLGSGFPIGARPLFQSPPPLRPLSPIRVSPSPPPQPQPQPQPQPPADVQPTPAPPPDTPAQLSPTQFSPTTLTPTTLTPKDMIFNVSRYEGNSKTIILHGCDFLSADSPGPFDWNRFVDVLTPVMEFNDMHEILVINLHHLVDDGVAFNEGAPFYRRVNEVQIAKTDPYGRPPGELWEKVKTERRALRAKSDE